MPPFGATGAVAEQLCAGALAVLRNNRRATHNPRTGMMARYTCPSPGLYPFQWFWDSCFHAVALAHLEPEVAREELELLLAARAPDGFIPHVVFWNRRTLFRHGLYWCWLQSRGLGVPRHSALIQPPVLALAVERYAEIAGDWELVRRALPDLDAYHNWLARVRDPDRDGLITIIAPWESGMDHKPSYDRALGLAYPAHPRDLAITPRLLDMANRVRGYHPRWLFARPDARGWRRFLVDDVLVNATYVASLRALARMHDAVECKASAGGGQWRTRAVRVEHAIRSRLRGPDAFFDDRDSRTGRLLPVRTVGGLTALLIEGLTDAEAAPLLAALGDPRAFGSTFVVPSVAMDEPSFQAAEMRYGASPLIWRGPVWININWLLVQALRRRGLHAEAKRIAASTIELVRRSGFREHYNPHTGEGYGARSFGWSTLVVDMLDGG